VDKNTNPIKTLLLLVESLWEIDAHPVDLKSHIDAISDSLLGVIESFHDEDELIKILDTPGINGNDATYYFIKHHMFTVLNNSIIDKLVRKKWTGGRPEGSLLDYSTAWDLYASNNKDCQSMVPAIRTHLFTFDR